MVVPPRLRQVPAGITGSVPPRGQVLPRRRILVNLSKPIRKVLMHAVPSAKVPKIPQHLRQFGAYVTIIVVESDEIPLDPPNESTHRLNSITHNCICLDAGFHSTSGM